MYSQLFFPKMALEKHSSSSVPHFPRLSDDAWNSWMTLLVYKILVRERDPGILKSQNML